ncbi:hypothetical protein [Prescottella equi]|uniref:hypothetical protein n=1 Tax=Rhodococcus hoagii TaxID=43767 RepID=UPI00111C8E90|nr:hypothetical protein [Prescottella equi]
MAEEFSVKFDGDALENHTMDVRTLAPSLLALGDAFQAANDALLISGPGVDEVPALQIRATRQGSFDIDLVIGALSSTTSAAAANGLGIASVTGSFLFGLVKATLKLIQWRAGRVISETAFNDRMITYVDTNGHRLEVPVGVDVLIDNGPFRAAISNFTQPLEVDGIDEVSFSDRSEGERSLVIAESDRESFRYQSQATVLDRSTRVATVKVETVQLSSDRDRKWRFSEGGETFTAAMKDSRFLLAVRSGRTPVGADDVLKVRMEEVVIKRPTGGVRVERTVEEVIKHDRALIQGELDYDFGA